MKQNFVQLFGRLRAQIVNAVTPDLRVAVLFLSLVACVGLPTVAVAESEWREVKCPAGQEIGIDAVFFGIRNSSSVEAAFKEIVGSRIERDGFAKTAAWFACQGFATGYYVEDSKPDALLVNLLKNGEPDELASEVAYWPPNDRCSLRLFEFRFWCSVPPQFRVDILFSRSGQISEVALYTFYKWIF